jgi:hypothetical protein
LYKLHKLLFEKFQTRVSQTNAQVLAKDRIEGLRTSYALSQSLSAVLNHQISNWDQLTVGNHLVIASTLLDQLQNGDGTSSNEALISGGLVHSIYKVLKLMMTKLNFIGPSY